MWVGRVGVRELVEPTATSTHCSLLSGPLDSVPLPPPPDRREWQVAYPAYPSIQSFVNKLLIFPKKNAQKPHCILNKVIHSMTMGPGLPQTRALVTKC